MNVDLQNRPTAGRTGHMPLPARRSIAVLPWILTAVLLITNACTLLSERGRSEGRAILSSVIPAAAGNATDFILGHGNRRELAAAAKTVSDLAKQNEMLAAHRTKLKSAVIRLQRENSAVKAQKVAADNHLLKLQAEHTGLRDRHIALEKDHRTLKDLSGRRAKAVKTVAERISRNLAIHAGELIAELPLRAAPYVGVFTLVTGTALDVMSDCELARALNGLVLEHKEAPLDTHAVCQYTDKIPPATHVWNTVKSKAGLLAVPVYQTIEKLYRR